MKLKKETENLIVENRGLVYYQLHKLGIAFKSAYYDDLISVGNLALIKAATTFDESKNIVFATYALTCIRNEMGMYFRKVNRYERRKISIEEPLKRQKAENNIRIEDSLKDPYNFEEEMMNKAEYVKLINIILNCLSGKERLAILYYIADEKQDEIAQNLKVSQSYISRLQLKAIRKTKNIAIEEKKYQLKFDMEIACNSEYEYEVVFLLKDVVRDKSRAEKISNWIKTIKKDLSFEIKCKNGNVSIQMFPYPEAISFLAKLIQKMEE